MRKTITFFALFQLFSYAVMAQLAVQGLLTENKPNPLGIDTERPRLSWQLSAKRRNTQQVAYEVRVATDATALAKGQKLWWESGKMNTDASVFVPYGGPKLQSGSVYYWQVRVWDNYGNVSPWSAPAFWQMGLLQPSDWKASWITQGFPEDTVSRPSPLLRKTFLVQKKVKSATAYITAKGLYEAFLNGQRIGDAYLTPGWTSYNNRVQYQQYDVTAQLTQGVNAIGAMLGSGWFRGNLAWGGTKNIYGKEAALLFQMDIVYADGSRESILSNEAWKSSPGPILSSEIYHGETNDARQEKEGWLMANYNDASWAGVKILATGKAALVATQNEPVKKHETFKPLRIFKTPKGEQVIDFGQNLVGWVQLRAKGKAGDAIRISHAEILDKAGNFYTENLRAAKQQNTYILKGGALETFEPHFTFQGFRYIRVEGYPGELLPENFTAVAVYSDMAPTGTFSCSNALLNQLQHNIQWGQKGNFVDVPTDCPQRDERLGWTGDAQVFSRTAAFNMNAHNFFAKWLKDVAFDQNPDGAVPFVVPNVLGSGAVASAGWADVATIIPWNMYLAYGDKQLLSDQYNSMKAWVGYMEKNSKNDLWNTGFHFGDWLFYSPQPDDIGRAAVTDKYLMAQCFFAHSAQLTLNAALTLGRTEDVGHYRDLVNRVKAAFAKEYLTGNGRLVSGTQTAYVLALQFDMLPEVLRPQAAERLVENIKAYDNHLSTGFLGTPYLCHVLSRYGYNDIAYQLLLQESYPSWLYPVKMGATTIWERWDGIKPDSSLQTPVMNSFNHYAYGAIGDWMYRVVAGLETDELGAGYKQSSVKPTIGGQLTQAGAHLQTYYGVLGSNWKIENGTLVLEVEIPANTSATIHVPATKVDGVKEGGVPLANGPDLRIVGASDGYVSVKVGSGKYRFESPIN